MRADISPVITPPPLTGFARPAASPRTSNRSEYIRSLIPMGIPPPCMEIGWMSSNLERNLGPLMRWWKDLKAFSEELWTPVPILRRSSPEGIAQEKNPLPTFWPTNTSTMSRSLGLPMASISYPVMISLIPGRPPLRAVREVGPSAPKTSSAVKVLPPAVSAPTPSLWMANCFTRDPRWREAPFSTAH